MYKYKTKNGLDCFITGVGQTENGIIVTDQILESPNLELIESPQVADQPTAVVGTEVAQPSVVTQAAPVAPAPTPVVAATPAATVTQVVEQPQQTSEIKETN